MEKSDDKITNTSSSDFSPLSSLSHDGTEKDPKNNNLNSINITNNKSPINSHPHSRNPSSSSELSPLSSLSGSSPPPDNPKHPPDPVDSPGSFDLSHGHSPAEKKRPSPVPVVNRNVREDPPPATTKVRQSVSILRRAEREKAVKRAALGFRVFGSIFCLVSLAVMAADKNKGWALDSFHRYKEFRYCISVNVVGFLYSLVQMCDLAISMLTGKYVLRHHYRFYFDFLMDQILTYLLMSASSSAATRVDDWQSNWGKDKFPEMATISVGFSFAAFVALAASTLISGYSLCTWSS